MIGDINRSSPIGPAVAGIDLGPILSDAVPAGEFAETVAGSIQFTIHRPLNSKSARETYRS